MKKVFEKFLITLLIIMMLTNFITVRPIYATTDEKKADFIDGLVGLLGGLVGILTLPERITAISVADAMNSLTAVIAYVDNEDSTKTKNTLGIPIITPYEILFNKVKIIEINFFDITDASGNDAGALVNKVRKGVAGWYYAMRNIAAAILLCILIYVGIRMAISTIASDRAMYKKMLVDWVCSLVLIFVLQYIMIFTIYVNNAIVNAINLAVGGDQVAESFGKIKDVANDIFNINALAATIVYCMLIWQTLGLFIAYFNRMIKLAFLIIISPLISITYSIDKIGDGKAQALGNWLKEFVFTILMQPFHCAIYMCMVDTAMDLLVKSAGGANKEEALGVAIVAILSVRFIKEGEKIVRKIFSFADDNKSTSLAAGMVASSMALSKARNIGHTAKNAGRGIKNFAKNLPGNVRNTGIETVAMAKYLFTNTGDKSFSDVKAEVKEKADNKSADRIEKYNDFKEKHFKRFRSTELSKKLKVARKASNEVKGLAGDQMLKEKMLQERTQEKLNASAGTMTESQARAEARRELAKEEALEKSAFGPGRRAIRGFKAFKERNHSEVAAVLKDLTKEKMSTGVGMAIGAGLYGSGKDFVTSMTSGAAIKGAVGEFLSGNPKQIMADSKSKAADLGIDSSEKLANTMSDIKNNSDKYSPGTDKAKEELDKLSAYLDTLEKSGLSPNIKSRIRNVIETDPKGAPDKMRDILAEETKSAKKKYSADSPQMQALNSISFDTNPDAKKLMEYANKCSLNASYNEALNNGITDAQFEANLRASLQLNENRYHPVTLATISRNDAILDRAKNYEVVKAENGEETIKITEAEAIIADTERMSVADIESLDEAFISEAQMERDLADTLEESGADEKIVEELRAEAARLDQARNEIISKAYIEKIAYIDLFSTTTAERYRSQIESKIQELQGIAENERTNSQAVQLAQLKEAYLRAESDPVKYDEKYEEFYG